jgi:hypothetical protein
MATTRAQKGGGVAAAEGHAQNDVGPAQTAEATLGQAARPVEETAEVKRAMDIPSVPLLTSHL